MSSIRRADESRFITSLWRMKFFRRSELIQRPSVVGSPASVSAGSYLRPWPPGLSVCPASRLHLPLFSPHHDRLIDKSVFGPTSAFRRNPTHEDECQDISQWVVTCRRTYTGVPYRCPLRLLPRARTASSSSQAFDYTPDFSIAWRISHQHEFGQLLVEFKPVCRARADV